MVADKLYYFKNCISLPMHYIQSWKQILLIFLVVQLFERPFCIGVLVYFTFYRGLC